MNTNPNAKRVMVYGDSFTFGKIPSRQRYASNVRFTGVIQDELGQDFEIIEEGLRGRTVAGENAFFPHRNGREQFAESFASYKTQIEWWCEQLGFPTPQVLLIAPPVVEEENSLELFKKIFVGAKEKSLEFPKAYKNAAEKLGWKFFDSSKLVQPSKIDGVHLESEDNLVLGKALAKEIR